jgi:cellulose synthase/poly-beta-1,6-N-acetylglucosamine synthase-like glycosyltransferase
MGHGGFGSLEAGRTASTVVLVPAHNEEEQIAAAIESLLAQTSPVEIVVCADNCTDETVAIAKSYPDVTVMETVGNTAKKAGALNQGWERFGIHADFLFTMDADTALAPDCIERMLDAIGDRGAVCAWPALKAPKSSRLREKLIHRCVRMDYGGFGRTVRARNYATEVLSGIGTMFKGEVLRAVAADHDGRPWCGDSVVEDYRISLDCRRLGYQIAVVPGAIASTDAIVEIKALWRQRTRWAGGTWQELMRHGWQPYTRRVWCSAALCMGSLSLRAAVVALWVFALIVHTRFHFMWIWLVPLLVSFVERLDVLHNTPGTDRKDLLLALSLVPMEAYTLLREIWTAWSLVRAVRQRKGLAW